MRTSLAYRYPRTLRPWTRADDKALLRSMAGSMSVLEVAEDLQREHVSVITRLSALDVFAFVEGSEEWVEFMGLALAGVPLKVVLQWCCASCDRLPIVDIVAMAMDDLRPEFNLARDYGLSVPNSDMVSDLGWLLNQPPSIQAGYRGACQRIEQDFEVLTPSSLKSELLGLRPAFQAMTSARRPALTPAKAGRQGLQRRAFKRPPVTTSRHIRAGTSRAAKARIFA